MEWTTGLHAPKGMAIMDESLYVTDIDEIVQIDLKTGEIQKKTPVENAEFLNDAATDGTYIYFSDMRTTKVRSEEHTSELQSRGHLVCRLLLEKKNNRYNQ